MSNIVSFFDNCKKNNIPVDVHMVGKKCHLGAIVYEVTQQYVVLRTIGDSAIRHAKVKYVNIDRTEASPLLRSCSEQQLQDECRRRDRKRFPIPMALVHSMKHPDSKIIVHMKDGRSYTGYFVVRVTHDLSDRHDPGSASIRRDNREVQISFDEVESVKRDTLAELMERFADSHDLELRDKIAALDEYEEDYFANCED